MVLSADNCVGPAVAVLGHGEWDFLGPCTQVQGRGPCPQGHGPHN